jgi:hypothetical protein
VPVPSLSFYNYSDNDTAALQSVDSNIPNAFPDITVMEAMLGDYNMDGYIDSTNNYTENPATTASFLLWSAGPDGQYGPVAPNANAATYFKSLSPNAVKNLVIKCDDVTNFTFAQ